MFDKDREYGRRLDQTFDLREEFIVWELGEGGTMITKLGEAAVLKLTVSRLDNPAERFAVTTVASAIVEKAADAEPEDFPAVVELLKVDGRYGRKALVLQFVREWTGEI